MPPSRWDPSIPGSGYIPIAKTPEWWSRIVAELTGERTMSTSVRVGRVTLYQSDSDPSITPRIGRSPSTRSAACRVFPGS